jgi:acyl carrier protein
MNALNQSYPTKDEVIEIFNKVLVMRLTYEDVHQKTLAEIGIDSMELLDINLALDLQYGLQFDLEKLSSQSKITDLIDDILTSRS